MSQLDTTNYTQKNLNKLMDTYNDSSNRLFDAKSLEEVEKIVEEVLEQLKSVRTNDQVQEAKQDVKDMLDEYMATLDTTSFSPELLNELIKLLNDTSNNLYNAETVAEVEKIEDGLLASLEEIEDKKVLESVKNEAYNELNEILNAKITSKDYTKKKENLIKLFNEESTKIYACENSDAVGEALEIAKNKLNAILNDEQCEAALVEVDSGIEQYKEELEEKINALELEKNPDYADIKKYEKQELDRVCKSVDILKKIADTQEYFDRIINAAKNSFDFLYFSVEQQKDIVDTLNEAKQICNCDDEEEMNIPMLEKSVKTKLEAMAEEYKENVKTAKNVDSIKELMSDYNTKIEELQNFYTTVQKPAVAEIQKKFGEVIDSNSDKIDKIGTAIETGIQEIIDAKDNEAVNKAVNKAIEAIKSICSEDC